MASRRGKGPPPLTDGPVWRFCPALAVHLGLVGAIVLERIWELTHSDRARLRPHAGRTFVFYSAKAMREDFSFLSRRRLGRAVDRLRKAGVLLRAKAKGEGRDADKWFAVDQSAVDALGTLFPASLAAPESAAPESERRRDAQGR